MKKQTTGSFVDVCFHVIITPTILINPEKDFVVIAFENYGGGWDSKKHKLKFERYVTLISVCSLSQYLDTNYFEYM